MSKEIKVKDEVVHDEHGKCVVLALIPQGLAQVLFDSGTRQIVSLSSLLTIEEWNRKKEARLVEAERIRAERARIKSELVLNKVKGLIADRKYEEAVEEFSRCEQQHWLNEDFQRYLHEAIERQPLEYDFVEKFTNLALGQKLFALDEMYLAKPTILDFSLNDFLNLKFNIVDRLLKSLGIELDSEQTLALAYPSQRLQIIARAGAGKTRTLSARAVLAIHDEKLDPNQVMILTFNKLAADEISHRVRELIGSNDYANARTFHSLAYQLCKPEKILLFDAGGHPSQRQQSSFIQRMLRRILNPAFKEEMYEFFRRELEQIEMIGCDLPPNDYYTFRRSLEHVTLGGQWVRDDGEKVYTNGERVKSKGEKFIADFFFEHDIKYRYERAWVFKAEFLGGAIYKPDFSIVANGRDYILEHWAFDPDDPNATLPRHWNITTEQYRRQIIAKRQFWASKDIPIIETHAAMLMGGREAFELRLKSMLKDVGIQCERLPRDEIVRRVFENEFVISRIADLFLQFIQRAKKSARSVDALADCINASRDAEPRAQSFHELALRAYREYEAMLVEENAMDFDDLLIQAAKTVDADPEGAVIHLGEGRMLPICDLRWILLDEYQDFSELYFRMLNSILKVNPRIRLVAVGDDWQAINSFAGAELRFFDRFNGYFSSASSAKVTTNYRSDRLVVAAGNTLMHECGVPAKVGPKAATGEIKIVSLSDVWVKFVQDGDMEQWQEDQKYLPPGTNGKVSEKILNLARAYKSCVETLLPALQGEAVKGTFSRAGCKPYAMLLSRTNMVYGIMLEEFKERLVQILLPLSNLKADQLSQLIEAVTAHRSKGREAHTVIILDATERKFPMLHPDNLLFQPFGVTPNEVLAEERRLFYVAITRAKHRLVVLTDKNVPSPYLTALTHSAASIPLEESEASELPELGPLANRINKKLDIP